MYIEYYTNLIMSSIYIKSLLLDLILNILLIIVVHCYSLYIAEILQYFDYMICYSYKIKKPSELIYEPAPTYPVVYI